MLRVKDVQGDLIIFSDSYRLIPLKYIIKGLSKKWHFINKYLIPNKDAIESFKRINDH